MAQRLDSVTGAHQRFEKTDLEGRANGQGVEPVQQPLHLRRVAEVAARNVLAQHVLAIFLQAPLVGHFPIRARGTFGGSVAHGDPASEWCMLTMLLDGEIVARGPDGERVIPAADFFLGFFTTALEPGEILTEVRLADPPDGAAIEEFARRHGDFAIVAAAAAIDVEDGACTRARVVVGGVDEVPLRLEAAEEVLAGSDLGAEVIEEAAQAAARAVEPGSDIHGSAEYRKKLTAVLLRRALTRAVGR